MTVTFTIQDTKNDSFLISKLNTLATTTGPGSVTSVAATSATGALTITGSPITTSGTLSFTVVSAPKWTTARTLSFTGDATGTGSVDGSASVATALTLAAVATAGTSTKVTYNAKGLVTSGTSATLASSDYANQGTTTTVLHGNAAGNPSWAAVSLANDVTGTLGVTRGGTGTATAFTAGSLVFAGASGVYAQSNADLFWDDTNKRLGIGTTSPNVKLEVVGSRSWFTAASDAFAVFTRYNAATAGVFYGCTSAGNTFQISNSAGSPIISGSTTAINITGTLSKGGGSFRVDHPLPELNKTHYLVHSFIEGPKADLIYRGRATLKGGVATVDLDAAAGMTKGTFVALCQDVQCFVSNADDWTPVRGHVDGSVLTIEAQLRLSTATVSWMVIGERADPFVKSSEMFDANGHVIVEPLKPPPEKAA